MYKWYCDLSCTVVVGNLIIVLIQRVLWRQITWAITPVYTWHK